MAAIPSRTSSGVTKEGSQPSLSRPTRRSSDGARITGDLTVRGVTRPVTLAASLYRRPGTAADDLDQLSIGLTGALNRHDFGASGYPDLVAETVGLDIHAEITRA